MISTEAVSTLTQVSVQTKLAELERGKLKLHIPLQRDLMKALPKTHFHLFPELFIQLSGITDFKFPREKIRVLPGDVCIVPRGVPHAETGYDLNKPFQNIILLENKNTLCFHTAKRRSDGLPIIDAMAQAQHPWIHRTWQYLDDIVEIYHSKMAEHKRMLHGLLTTFLSSLLNILSNPPTPHSQEPIKIIQARQWVLTHLSDPDLSVQSIARRIQCAPDYLSHIFHKTTGIPLVRFINEHRIEHAINLLENSTMNFKEIAMAVGYEDPSYFTRIFRQTTGSSPREHQKSLKKRFTN